MMRRFLYSTALALILAMFCIRLDSVTHWSDRANNTLLDLWLFCRGPLETPRSVIIVGIDEESYRRLHVDSSQYFPRKHYAVVTERLAAYGAKVLAFDLVPQTDGSDLEADEAWVRSMSLMPVILPAVIDRKTLTTTRGKKTVFEKLQPLDKFQRGATALGDIMVPMTKGIARHFLAGSPTGLPPLSEVSVRLAGKLRAVPASGDMVRYYGPAGSILYVPIHEVLEDSELKLRNLFQNRIVFLGATVVMNLAGVERDVVRIPASDEKAFGVEWHATAAANLIDQKWLKLPFGVAGEVWAAFGGVFMTSILVAVLPPVAGAFALAVIAAGWLVSSYVLFLHDLVLPGLLVPVYAVFAYLISLFTFYRSTYRQSHSIRKVFSRYVAPDVVEKLIREPENARLGGQKTKLVLFFTDIAGFSHLAQHMEEEKLFSLLNSYFSTVVHAVQSEGGTVLGFIGDALFAAWGAPLTHDDDSDRAVRAALEIQKRVRLLSPEGALNTRVGIHYGSVVIGNFGAEDRFTYTALGDAVNIASRLEGANKFFGTSILVSQELKEKLVQTAQPLYLGKFRLAGRDEATIVYAVLEQADPRDRYRWLRGICHFNHGNFEKAGRYFRLVQSLPPQLPQFLLAHLDQTPATHVQGVWNGEISLTK